MLLKTLKTILLIVIALTFSSCAKPKGQKASPQPKTNQQPNKKKQIASPMIDKVTLAIKDMDACLSFYSAILETEFKAIELQDQTLYEAHSNGVEFLLCPRKLAQVDEAIDNNTVQLRLVVLDLRAIHAAGLANGGKEVTGILESGDKTQSSLRDPDGNSIELIQINR